MSILSFDVGIKNLAFCVLKENKILHWNVSELKYSSNQSLCEAVVNYCDMWPQMLECHTVLIEKQPSRNNKMRIIEALLNAYFVIKGIKSDDSQIAKVLVISAKYKLGSNTAKGKTNYNERKKLSVERCKKFMTLTENENQDFKEIFEKSKKKDDLADTLLQALAYNKSEMFQRLQDVDFKTSTPSVSARKPTDKQERTGNYSRSNVKYFLLNMKYNDSNCPTKLQKAVKKHYDTLENAYKKLDLHDPQND